MNDQTHTTLTLNLALDRTLAWHKGSSVRYAVADLRVAGSRTSQEAPALNLALAIDVSSSMAGPKIEAARQTALAVIEAMTPRDRLTLVAFDSVAELLLDARQMDDAGRAVAVSAVQRLTERGGTNLWEGWLLASEHVAAVMTAVSQASHRVLLLSDGEANDGVTNAVELAHHARGLLERGIITSAVGIGDGYDELLLGGMAEAGGGRMHDAEHASEISEVVLGELLEGRSAVLERASLRLAVPANVRAELIGGWAHKVLPGAIEVSIGSVLPEVPVRVVFRLHCPGGSVGTVVLLGASVRATAVGSGESIEAGPADATLSLVRGRENNAQKRDSDVSMVALTAWQADVIRQSLAMNRSGDLRSGKHFLEREIHWMERYARGLPGADTLLAELVLLLRRSDERYNPRLRKELYAEASMRAFWRGDHRQSQQTSLSERLRREDP